MSDSFVVVDHEDCLCDLSKSVSPQIERFSHTHRLRESIKTFTIIFTFIPLCAQLFDNFNHFLRIYSWRFCAYIKEEEANRGNHCRVEQSEESQQRNIGASPPAEAE